jgi:N,N-dimethylformamidase beta subunit-like, C-terminal
VSVRRATAVLVVVILVLFGLAIVPGGSSVPILVAPVLRPSPAATAVASPLRPPPPEVTVRTIGGPRPNGAELLAEYQYGEPPVPIAPGAAPDDWRLDRPDLAAVAGYAGQTSVLPGGTLSFHIRSRASTVRLDVFRIGAGDARHVLTVPGVAVRWHRDAPANPVTGRVEDTWPISYTLTVPASWASGFYLVKCSLPDGRASYIPFVVRPSAPAPLLVVVPMLTYEAYNGWGGTDLYGWYRGPRPRAVEASFDRPFEHGYGAGTVFRLDFPLWVWLEDHGYRPSYATDIDVAHDPALVTAARTVILSGHPEYWLRGDRDALDAAQRAGVGILGMGADMGYWQVRTAPSAAGVPDRTVVCWKSATQDPIAATDPLDVTSEFSSSPLSRPVEDLLGEAYGGIVQGLQSLVVGPGMASFASDSGLKPGQRLPGLVGDEIDLLSRKAGALILGATPVTLVGHSPGIAGASAWVTASGAHVFDAGTFDWSWGLDPRYAAALPGFPADSYARLMADILSWAGTPEPGG